jgi:putative flippase GtrA
MIRARELGAFTAVGSAATSLHMGVVATSVPHGLSPLIANVFGYGLACAVSFIGHERWSFPAAGRPLAPALRRFAAVSALCFALNEGCYAGALLWTRLDYRVALVAVIATVGLAKLVASKHWVFGRP